MMAKLSVDQALLKAMSYNKKGKIEEAKQIYRDILSAFPENKRAQQGFAALNKFNQSPKVYGLPKEKLNQLANLYKQGQLEAVIKQGTQLIEQYPKAFIIWNIIGAANQSLGQLVDAYTAYSKATELNPNYADGFNNLGILLQNQGRVNDAITYYAKALAIRPDYVEALNNMGVALHEQGKMADAIRTYKKVLAIKPDYAEAYYNMGTAFKDQRELDGAVKAYKKALAIKPDYLEALNNIGATFKEQGKMDEAIGAFINAVSLDPNNIGAYYNMGICLKSQRKLDKAVEAYIKVVNIKPDHTEAHYNMGVALQEQGRLDTAIEAYTKALAIKPYYAEAYCNMGLALADQGKLEEAIKAYNKSLSIEPNYADAHCNLGYALLAAKNFHQGFKHHEWRWKTKTRVDYFLKSAKPIWDGENNQRVLVWGEQGIGDEIMFSSVILDLYAASLQVLVKCDERLIPLFKRSFPADIAYFSKSKPVPEDKYDFHIPVGSLPLTFRKSQECFRKNASGFLKCDMPKAERIKTLLKHKNGGKIIGISWKTKSVLKNASNRDVKLAELAKALDRSNTQLLCLQYGDVFDEIEAVRRDFGINVTQFGEIDNMSDIDGLASLIMACDQIVSTTNATVHLAGALGAKVTALLPFSPRWIWGTGYESFWYETVTPLKQKSHHNWDNVLENLRSI